WRCGRARGRTSPARPAATDRALAAGRGRAAPRRLRSRGPCRGRRGRSARCSARRSAPRPCARARRWPRQGFGALGARARPATGPERLGAGAEGVSRGALAPRGRVVIKNSTAARN
ncbi:unnamed protein product, partial [Prorocentrum cordatum]